MGLFASSVKPYELTNEKITIHNLCPKDVKVNHKTLKNGEISEFYLYKNRMIFVNDKIEHCSIFFPDSRLECSVAHDKFWNFDMNFMRCGTNLFIFPYHKTLKISNQSSSKFTIYEKPFSSLWLYVLFSLLSYKPPRQILSKKEYGEYDVNLKNEELGLYTHDGTKISRKYFYDAICNNVSKFGTYSIKYNKCNEVFTISDI